GYSIVMTIYFATAKCVNFLFVENIPQRQIGRASEPYRDFLCGKDVRPAPLGRLISITIENDAMR
ncbi:hypothetical protein, partial [Herbaspirillum sp. B65]|uniref:hypothetical protein n=1 Tax=Herbaspirillum sp. B65 TaxID=137708 RepID=UPI001C27AE89